MSVDLYRRSASFVNSLPRSDSDTGEDRSAKCRAFVRCDRRYGLAIHVRLDLPPKLRSCAAATKTDLIYRRTKLAKNVDRLAKGKCDAFHYRPRQMTSSVT